MHALVFRKIALNIARSCGKTEREISGTELIPECLIRLFDFPVTAYFAFAFDERLGFLTAVPTNLGTGMQAMLDLHLPALAGQGLIDQLTVMIGKLGLSLQPLYDGHGSFYRLTNQVTLGITEKAAIDNVNAICDQIVRQERNLRQQLQDAFLDRIYRAMGTLQMARTLNQDEFFDLVSLLRLGISLGESSKTYSDVGELIQKVQNATIAAAAGAEVTADAVDKIRAGLVRQALA